MHSQSMTLMIIALQGLSHHNRALVLREFDAHTPEQVRSEFHESVINRAASLYAR